MNQSSIITKYSEEGWQNIWYHTDCRKKLMHPKNIINESTQVGLSDIPKRQSMREFTGAFSSSRIYKKKCIICGKDKYRKKSNTRETLRTAKDVRSDKTLREKAIEKGHSQLIALTSRNIVAAQASHHHTCYSQFTKSTKVGKVKKEQEEEFYL